MDERVAVLEIDSMESISRDEADLTGSRGAGVQEGVLAVDRDAVMEDALLCGLEAAELLTSREEEILEMIVAGRTNKQIARQLCRSERTIEYHRNRLMRKMGAHNSAELVKKAISMSLV